VENAVMAHEVEHSAITTEASAEAAFLLIIMVARKKSRVGSGQVRQDYLWVWEDGATALEMNWLSLSWSTVNSQHLHRPIFCFWRWILDFVTIFPPFCVAVQSI